ncbi:MAG: hypothetical protein ACP5HM_10825 [Anaerolineae bacterium]
MKERRTLLTGILFVGGALLCGMVGLFASGQAGRRVQQLTPAPIAQLEAMQPGAEVLVEGRISSENTVQASEFVAYVREERRVDEEGDTGSWSVRERVTPPLLLELRGGWVQIENSDYDLVDAKTVEKRDDPDEPSTTRYKGLERGDSVIAVGVLVAQREYPNIEADFVARGTRESYIARRRAGGRIFCGFSLLIAVIGGGILMKAIV